MSWRGIVPLDLLMSIEAFADDSLVLTDTTSVRKASVSIWNFNCQQTNPEHFKWWTETFNTAESRAELHVSWRRPVSFGCNIAEIIQVPECGLNKPAKGTRVKQMLAWPQLNHVQLPPCALWVQWPLIYLNWTVWFRNNQLINTKNKWWWSVRKNHTII